MMAFWFGLPAPVRRVLVWIGVLLGVILFGRAYLSTRDAGVRKKERAKNEAATIAVVHETVLESVSDADKAVAARDTAHRVDSPASVPDETAGRIFRD